jgi:signal transduction histidine kinase
MSRFHGLFGRLLGFYLLIVVGTLGILGVTLDRLLQSYFFAAKQQELVSKGTTVAELAGPLFRGGANQRRARRQLAVVGRLLTGGALIIGRQGQMLDAVGRRPAAEFGRDVPCPITQELPELMGAMEGRVVTRTGYSPIFRESAFFAAVPIRVDGSVVGAVIMHSPVLGMRSTVAHTRLLVFGLALAAIALSSLLGYLLAGSIAKPLRRMSTAAGHMAAGDFEGRVPERGADEVAQLGRALNQMSTELQRLERMRRQFVADASHQLRAPLTAMQGHAEALLDDVAPDEAARTRYLASIVRDCRRLNHLIEQLLDLSHLESGHAKLTLRPLAIPALINRIVGSIGALEEQPNLTVDTPAGLPPALADEAYTEQALLNLLANALRYTPPEGRVTVWARPEPEVIRVGVTDTGRGIAPEHLPHIWERFYRAEERGRDGAGLGLAIVKSLVERQGGQVSAESRLGAGSTFSFTLPLAPQQDPSHSLDPPLTLS